jgi:hypothetical protein
VGKPYIILSLKHSEGKKPTFWRPDNSGHTQLPWAAGVYTKEQVEARPKYYNDGWSCLAIELSNEGLESIGFTCQMDLKKLEALKSKILIVRGKEVSDV